MDINQVIHLGKEIEKIKPVLNTGVVAWIVGLVILAVVIFGVVVIFGIDDLAFLISPILLIAAGIFVFGFFDSVVESDRVYRADVEKWKEEVAFPYLDSIEKVQREIVFIKIDPELSDKTSDFLFMGTGSINSKEVQKTPLVVSYRDDDGIITRTDWVPTTMELTDEIKPYIEFQELEKDLGHGIEAGLYNPQVYLPESYTFTDIK